MCNMKTTATLQIVQTAKERIYTLKMPIQGKPFKKQFVSPKIIAPLLLEAVHHVKI